MKIVVHSCPIIIRPPTPSSRWKSQLWCENLWKKFVWDAFVRFEGQRKSLRVHKSVNLRITNKGGADEEQRKGPQPSTSRRGLVPTLDCLRCSLLRTCVVFTHQYLHIFVSLEVSRCYFSFFSRLHRQTTFSNFLFHSQMFNPPSRAINWRWQRNSRFLVEWKVGKYLAKRPSNIQTAAHPATTYNSEPRFNGADKGTQTTYFHCHTFTFKLIEHASNFLTFSTLPSKSNFSFLPERAPQRQKSMN